MENLPTRKRNRLKNFDYSGVGSYFVTICCQNRRPLFWADAGQVCESAEDIVLSSAGKIVDQVIMQIPDHYKGVSVVKYCIMPDHVHILLFIESDPNGVTTSAPEISAIIGQMKRQVSRRLDKPIWQKSFFDRVIRSDREYTNVWRYIDQNPCRMDRGDDTIIFTLLDEQAALPQRKRDVQE